MDDATPLPMPPAERSAPGGWLLTITQLPTEDPASRMRVLRTLESLGAAVMREGVFLLPDTPGNRQSLQTLIEYILKVAGSAHLLHVGAVTPAQHEDFKRLFDRSARYENLIKTVESLRIGFGHSDPSAISRVVHKQRREFESIAALDFFPTASRARAQETLTAADAEVRKLLFPAQANAALAPGEALLGRTWVTRKPLWADRLASASCARLRAAVGKKSSAAIASNSRRCLCTTREIALGSEWPKPMRRLSTVLIRFS